METRPGSRFQIDKSSTDGMWPLNRRGLRKFAYKTIIPPLSPGDMSETAPSRRLKVRFVDKQPFVMDWPCVGGSFGCNAKHASRRVGIEECPSSRSQILPGCDIVGDFDLAVVPRLWKLVFTFNGNVGNAGNIVQIQDGKSVRMLDDE